MCGQDKVMASPLKLTKWLSNHENGNFHARVQLSGSLGRDKKSERGKEGGREKG